MSDKNNHLLWQVCLSLAVSAANAVVNTPGVILTTRLGRIRGTVETIDDGPGSGATPGRALFHAFRGIPYAKAPVGHLRWQEPIAYGMWPSDLDATTFRSPCPQFDRASGNVVGSEDCLFLNVYTPHTASVPGNDAIPRQGDSTAERSFSNYLPVMVWFHGGGYNRGGSHQFGPQFLMREDLVLVTVNYRLGLLGFLSTGDAHLPGNYGMLDAVEALKWVRDHIVSFGGDPERVTIFGESAGAAITHLLSLSPLAAGLFRRIIFQSASALCQWSVEINPLEFAQQIAKHLQCPVDPAGLVSCVRGKDPQQLVRAQVAQQRYSLMPVRCGPVVDAGLRVNPFLPDMPRNIILRKAYNSVPMISGVTLNEGLLFYLWIYTENVAKMSNAAFLENDLVPGLVSSIMSNQSHMEDVVKLVKQQYLGGVDYGDIQSLMPRISQIIDDSMFTSCVYEAQILHAKTSPAPLYAYVFSYKGQETPSYAAVFSDLVRRSGFEHALMKTGVTHADELLYLFRMAGFPAAYSPADLKMSQQMTRLWAQFARTGDPVQQGAGASGESPIWPRVSPVGESVIYYKLDGGRGDAIGADFRKAEHHFWLHVVPHVRDAVSAHQQINETSLAATWALLGLFVAAIAVIAVLVVAIIRKDRKRRYPEKGVLQRTN